VKTLTNLYNEGELFHHIGITCLETIVGFVLGTIIGTIIAVILWGSEFLSKVLEPYLVILNSLPKIALGPIFIIWIGAGSGAIIVMALAISLIVTILEVLNGFLAVDQEKIKLVKTFGATKFQTLTKVVLPSNIPTIINALKINVGLSWVGVIVGEFLVSKAGLGYLIVYGGQVFQLDLVMTSVLILAAAAAIMYQGVVSLEKILMKGKNRLH
jgi:NitT/TauT family transport system permease protein